MKEVKDLIAEIEEYEPFDEKEEGDKKQIINFLKNNPNALERSNDIAHLTVSAWVVNPSRDKVLMAYHNIYDSWAWLGGHADGNCDLLQVAMKEAREEAGLEEVKAVTEQILSMETLTVAGHVKKGKWVSSHLHFNLTYLIEAEDSHVIKAKEDENSDVAWFTFHDALEASKEPWMVENVYKKICRKIETFWR